MKKVYTCFCTDVIHKGHLNILKKAAEYGEVTVGVLSDRAMVKYNRFPTLSFEERMELVRRCPGVSHVVVQDEVMYDGIISKLRPDYVIHGDNWKRPPASAIRENVIGLLKQYGGELVEVPYTYDENVKRIDDAIMERLAMPEFRRGRLKKQISMGGIVKAIEAHSGLTGLIAEKTIVEYQGEINQFDAMWSPACVIPQHAVNRILNWWTILTGFLR